MQEEVTESLKLANIDKDGKIDYKEFTKVLTSDDIMSDKIQADNTSLFSHKTGKEARHRAEGDWGSNAATGFKASL